MLPVPDRKIQELFSDELLNSALDKTQEIARGIKRGLKPGQEIVPALNIVYLGKENFKHRTVGPDFGDTLEERQQEMREIADELGKEGLQIVAAYLTTEAWSLKLPKDEELVGRVSEDKRKVEVLMTAGRTIDGRCAFVDDEIDGKTLIPHMYVPYRPGQQPMWDMSLLNTFFNTYITAAARHMVRKMKQSPELAKVAEMIDKLLVDMKDDK